MKRIYVLMILIVVLVVTSCTAKFVCPDGSTVSQQELCPAVEKHPQLSAEIQDFLLKSSKVDGMYYKYKRVDKPTEGVIDVWVKGKYVKQELNVQTQVLNKNQMDVIIFDTENRTAQAYCESKTYCIKTGNIGAVNFDQYYLKTPLDWVKELTAAEKISEAIIENRNVWQLKTETGSLWVDTYFGVPLRVDAGAERHEFQNIVFNSVADGDVHFAEKKDDMSY